MIKMKEGAIAHSIHSFISEHPGSRNFDICNHFGLKSSHASSILNAMYVRGDLNREGKPGGRLKAEIDSRGYRYFAVNRNRGLYVAFKSQITISEEQHKAKGRTAAISIRKASSGSTAVYFSALLPLRGKTVDIQLDEETGNIRVGEARTGAVINSLGQASCSGCLFDVTGKVKIELKLSDDGWWYGNYKKLQEVKL